MFKVLLFFVLFCYVIYRVTALAIKVLTFGSVGSRDRVHKNKNAMADKQSNPGKKSFNGGEYVDFEEVN